MLLEFGSTQTYEWNIIKQFVQHYNHPQSKGMFMVWMESLAKQLEDEIIALGGKP